MAKKAKPGKKTSTRAAAAAKRSRPAKKAVARKAARPKTARQLLVITLTGDHPIHEVAGRLKAAGLTVDQVLTSTGIVTGSAHPDAAKRLRQVQGVADVSPDHPVDIGPPGASIS